MFWGTIETQYQLKGEIEMDNKIKKHNSNLGYRKTYPPIEITPDSIIFPNVTVYPKKKEQYATTAYGWQRKRTRRDDYYISLRIFRELQITITWKVLEAMCDSFAGTKIYTTEQWKELNLKARNMVTDVKRRK